MFLDRCHGLASAYSQLALHVRTSDIDIRQVDFVLSELLCNLKVLITLGNDRIQAALRSEFLFIRIMQPLEEALLYLLHFRNPLVDLLLRLRHLAHLELIGILGLQCLVDLGLHLPFLQVAFGLHHVGPGLLLSLPLSDLVYLLCVYQDFRYLLNA